MYSSFRSRRYFIAALLYNNDELLPFWTRELFKLLLVLTNDERSNVFVSIFESGSTDETKPMLRTLRDQLVVMGVGHEIQTVTATRKEYTDRIEHLAVLRNEALRPLFESDEQWDQVRTRTCCPSLESPP